MTRIFILDDHTILRSALRLLLELEEDLEVVGEAGSLAEAGTVLPQAGADVCLVDLTLPDGTGLEFVRRMKPLLPQVRFLALTMHDEEKYLLAFLEAGGMGYLHKSMADQELIRAIHQVMEGKVYLGEKGIQLMARQWTCPTMGAESAAVPESQRPALSEREREVLVLVARGLTSAEIGRQLYLSPRTIDTYRNRLMRKLELNSRAELVDYVMRHHLLDDPNPASSGL